MDDLAVSVFHICVCACDRVSAVVCVEYFADESHLMCLCLAEKCNHTIKSLDTSVRCKILQVTVT